MADKFSKQVRSKIMSSIRGKNTKPEVTIRKMVWMRGKRYRIHDRSVFGNPDISNRSKNLAVFIDGCFWHGCKRCYKEPKTNTEFWRSKISRNQKRRKVVRSMLKKDGITMLQFWEHEIISNPELVADKISTHL